MTLIDRIRQNNDKPTPFFQIYNEMLFTTSGIKNKHWTIVIPKIIEKALIQDYHDRYGHMRVKNIVKALEEHVYIKGLCTKVSKIVKICKICQLVKCNNERKEATMIPVQSSKKLEKVFLDICELFSNSEGCHTNKFILIMFDHFTKYTKLYSLRNATTKSIIDKILNSYVPELGITTATITDHGTHFKGRNWCETMNEAGTKTYKISVYQPSSNPVERALRELGRILRMYCNQNNRTLSIFIEKILNINCKDYFIDDFQHP